MPELIKIGYILRPHGTKGELKIFIERFYQNALKKNGAFFISEHFSPLPFFIETISINQEGAQIIIKIEDLNSREDAQKLSGKEIFIETNDLKVSGKENKYNTIIGYDAVSFQTREKIGMVADILEISGQNLAQIFVDNKEILLPLHKETVNKIDKKNKQVLLEIPDGLLDIF